MPGSPLFHLPHQSRGHNTAGGTFTKKQAYQGVTACPGPSSMGGIKSPSPHSAINTYSTNMQKRNLQISISKPHHNKDIKVHALYYARVLLWVKLFSVSSKRPHFPLPTWNNV